jgi:hypothetical protein
MTVAAVMTPAQVSAIPTDEVTKEATTVPVSKPSPTKSPVAPLTILAGLMTGMIVAAISRRS